MNTFARAIALILTILMVAILPLRYMSINQTAVNDNIIDKETKEFADEIMTQGYLSLDMYNGFLDQLSVTDQMYDIDLIHSKPKQSYEVAASNYQDEDNDINIDIAKENENIKQLSFISSEDEDQNNFIALSNHKNTGFKQAARSEIEENSIFSFATHTHNNDCYVGHRHTEACNRFSPKAVITEKHYDAGNSSIEIDLRCPTCGGDFGRYINFSEGHVSIYTYSAVYDYYYSDQFQRDAYLSAVSKFNQLYSAVLAYCPPLNGYHYSGYWHYYTSGVLPSTAYTNEIVFNGVPSYCNFCYASAYNSCGQVQDETPICNQVVTSITATNSVQTVKKGETIITIATATYLDGHTGIVNCTSNFNTNLVGSQSVTLTYSGKVGNAKTTGTLTCIVSATVKDTAIPKTLTVTPSSYTVYNGSEPSYIVEVTYEDGTKKVIVAGYTKTGFTTGAGSKEVSFSYSENSKTVTSTIIILVKRNVKICINGHTYELDDFDSDLGCSICNETINSIIVSPDTLTVTKGSDLKITVTARYMDNHTVIVPSGWTSNFDNTQSGEQLITITYNGKTAIITVIVEDKTICPICGITYINDGFTLGCPVCSKKVVSIMATPITQTIPIGEDMAIEVEALYQDGHKAIVTGWTSNFNPFKIGSQDINITYETASTTINVIVDSGTDITCPICGTTYSLITNPDGCPVCSVKIDHIEARLRSEGTKVQLGSELNLYIIMVFKDSHKEKAFSDWEVEGFSSDILGEQTLTIKYRGFETTLIIEVIDTLKKVTCPNGHVYYLNEDGSDPGCPYCNIDEISGISSIYLECIYTVDIIEILYSDGTYTLEKGDFFTVEVHKKTASVYDRIKNFWNMEHAEFKKFTYGGMVNN